ncbi:MAG: lysylphosphatidylglycerol synthase transmembrane domain-containing protein [Elusimicrobiota bacterium]
MKQKILSTVKFLAFFSFGIFLIWLVIKDLSEKDKSEILHSLREADYRWVILSIIIGVISHILRTLRWKLLLLPLGHNPKISNTFYSVMAGYLANFGLPRLGEFVRCGLLKQYENIPFSQSFGTVIAERTIDLLTLFLIFIFTLYLEFASIYDYAYHHILLRVKIKMLKIFQNEMVLWFILLSLFAVIVAFLLMRKKNNQNSFLGKIKNAAISFQQGLLAIRNVRNPIQFIIYSILIWFMYFLAIYFCTFSLPETSNLSLGACFVILSFGSLGVIVAPGGIGAYQLIVKEILVPYGFTGPMIPKAIAFGWITWIAQFALVFIVGILSFVMLGIINKKKR